jgi:putative transposase
MFQSAQRIQLVEKHIIRREDDRFALLDKAAFAAKNIYNAANYQLRQAFFFEKRRLSYNQQEKGFKKHHLLPDQQLPTKIVQQVLMQLHRDWDSYAAAASEYQTNPRKFRKPPRLPRYKDKATGRAIVVFTDQAISAAALKKGEIVLSGLNVSIKTRQRIIDQVRVVPHSSHYVIEVVYSVPVKTAALDFGLYAGVDIGLNNLAALTSNKPGFAPFLVNGRPLKSINQFYNQRRAELKGLLVSGQSTSQRLEALSDKHNRRIDALFHLASRYIVDMLVREGIGNLVIGKTAASKPIANADSHMVDFAPIPYTRFTQMLVYKAQLVGIHVLTVNESYTSKVSFVDREPVLKQTEYRGERIKRGLYKTSTGKVINADLNAAYNIVRLMLPTAFSKQMNWPTHAKRLNPREMQMDLQTWEASHNGRTGANERILCSAPVMEASVTNRF